MEVTVRCNKRHIPVSEVIRLVKKFAREVLSADSNLNIAFLSDNEMIGANETYTGRRGTTDVLSFPYGRDFFDGCWYGEVLISMDRAFKQAREKGVSLFDEIVRLLIHALVHLGGYDHHNKKSFKDMRRKELSLLVDCLKDV